jgi:hypothetical protein
MISNNRCVIKPAKALRHRHLGRALSILEFLFIREGGVLGGILLTGL